MKMACFYIQWNGVMITKAVRINFDKIYFNIIIFVEYHYYYYYNIT